jgi:hypothetical protein
VFLPVVLTVIVAIAMVGRSRVALPPMATVPGRLVTRLATPESLEIEFVTPIDTVWTLETVPGKSHRERAAARRHRFVVPVDPEAAPLDFTLVSGAGRFNVPQPPWPVDLIRHLDRSVRQSRTDARSLQQVWDLVRSRAMTMDPQFEAADLAAQVREHPEIADPVRGFLSGLAGPDRPHDLMDRVRPFVAPLLLSGRISKKTRQQIADTLVRLDLVDALASTVGLPAPFDVAGALFDVVNAQPRDPSSPTTAPATARSVWRPTPLGGILYTADEFAQINRGGVLGEIVSRHREERQPLDRLGFPGGRPRRHRTLYFNLGAYRPVAQLRIAPPGWAAGLPVRIPRSGKWQMAGWFAVRFDPALADGPGDWSVTLDWPFWDGGRTYLLVDEVRIDDR